jgi:O-antigen/teichoic acid export membrane protein
LSGIKQLAGQTFWYGLSSMGARFLNYLLTPILTLKMSAVAYGEMSLAYASVPFLNILFTYGMETAFFRYAHLEDQKKVFHTTATSLLLSSILLCTLMILFQQPLANLTSLPEHPDYILLIASIIFLDTLATIPFAWLRLEGRPIRFALTRIAGILVNIAAVLFFLVLLPYLAQSNPRSFWADLYRPENSVRYVLWANLIQAFITLVLLSDVYKKFRFSIDPTLWKKMILYSLPLTVAGFAGMINETMDRLMLGWLLPLESNDAVKVETGIYSAVYKLSLLITLFIQAFRMSAEPFFFKQAGQENANRVYVRVMKFFVIAVSVMFMVVALYLDIWKQFIQNPIQWQGLHVVPILLFANIFLGIYYNLSIWYKISGKTSVGATITLIGAAITLGINFLFIPKFSYTASAWATFFCYGTMMVVSYLWGQKAAPIPYPWKKLLAYLVIVALIFGLHQLGITLISNKLFSYSWATVLLLSYLLLLSRIEKKEFQQLPIIGKYFK